MASRWPSDYSLFPKRKKRLYGTRFSSDSDVETAAENWLNGQDVISAKTGETSWSCVQINASTDFVTMRKSDRQVCL
ncbi:hypothetical protein AVEN_136286-1 [Araneus ventricosus]|uniref:DUF4817 domain-containing protein n=1 Tax=Araneus ventricosus TaxID=182803 RepID=A0A4Y2VY93_ARAVE|nr:hypothetical protein AVEN_11861-1 [Araneus ventricosus]GBO30119.1 hypothetical protein AVEN_136286-1 [Araneus ventricosus]